MTRWKLTIEYDGGPFVGWQRQENGLTVQQVVEDAVQAFSGEGQIVHASGRTDAGVHARGQVAHVDIAAQRSAKDVRDGLNFHLRPHPVAILAAEEAAADFDARRSAIEREYLYLINNRRAALALDRGRMWHIPYALDAAAMHDAAQALLGQHDFSSFRAAECQAKSPIKTLDELTVWREGEHIFIKARARSFLHHQVRNMVGTLALVGQGKWTRADVAAALAACARAKAGPTAPPDGLYFMKVRY